MTVEQELKFCLMVYPNIFPNKWAVYHHWFAVNGNGYKWINGELVDSESDREPITIKKVIEKHFEFHTSDRELLHTSLRFRINRLKEDILASLEWESKKDDFTSTREKLYPLCEYAKILNLPNDIKEDWKQAAREFHQYLLDDYDSFTDSDRKYIDLIRIDT